jgi:hypothetical protein
MRDWAEAFVAAALVVVMMLWTIKSVMEVLNA